MVKVEMNGQSVEIEDEVWSVLMQAINRLVDSGDISLLDPTIGSALLARAKMSSGALYVIANRPARAAPRAESQQ